VIFYQTWLSLNNSDHESQDRAPISNIDLTTALYYFYCHVSLAVNNLVQLARELNEKSEVEILNLSTILAQVAIKVKTRSGSTLFVPHQSKQYLFASPFQTAIS